MPSNQAAQTEDNAVYTTSNGAPVKEPFASQRAGFNGPLLLQGMPPTIVARWRIR